MANSRTQNYQDLEKIDYCFENNILSKTEESNTQRGCGPRRKNGSWPR
jgi:hypothetical protein